MQLPLPKQIDTQKVIAAIDPAKDVDGFHPLNVGRLASGLPALVPCTPMGCVRLAIQAARLVCSGTGSARCRWRTSRRCCGGRATCGRAPPGPPGRRTARAAATAAGPPPRGGAVSAAAIVAASSTFAMNTPALFCSMPAP